MRKNLKLWAMRTALLILLLSGGQLAQAQKSDGGRTEYTGSLISFNGPRTETGLFNLRLNGRTSDEQAKRFLGILKDKGQDDLQNAIRSEDLGSFSVDGSLGLRLNVVRESTVENRRRIFAVFERYTRFAELRGGFRSLDYPFGVIEIYIDERGRGEGTLISAAKIRLDEDDNTVEIENFATYPVKLTNIKLSGERR